MKSYCVYVHKKITDNSIFYVGKARGHKRARSKSSRSEYWKRVERKHGRTVHIVSEGLSNDEACELEIFLISEIGRDNLVNMTAGGEGTPGRFVSEETREKVRNKNKGVRPAEHAIMSAVKKTRKPVVTLCGMRFDSISEAARRVMPDRPRAAKINISSCCNGVSGQHFAYGLAFRFEVDGEPYSGNHLSSNNKEKSTSGGYVPYRKNSMKVSVNGVTFHSQAEAARYMTKILHIRVSQPSLSAAIKNNLTMYKGMEIMEVKE